MSGIEKFENNILTDIGAMNMAMIAEERNRLKLEAGGSLTKCFACNKGNNENKRCTGCYMVWYCGQECRYAGWERHKVECKKTRKEYKTVKLIKSHSKAWEEGDKPYELHLSLTKGTKQIRHVGEASDPPKKSHFVVKVQISVFKAEGPMFIYNQDRSMQGYLCFKGNEKVYDELNQQIKNRGFQGLKGYFRAILDSEKVDSEGLEIKVNPYKLQIVETW
eukprot:TRINITY_DN34193_c0_g1_i1.p1 TRINITY_DN34193_c0_g1~~TRINITY_DN34193_c0_g1_i1.p1  ORF type:complete len:235 (+),score=56.90 TRINITY_DN34193_c0_g1_i1:48-707(+)